jgi:hypothetical protein
VTVCAWCDGRAIEGMWDDFDVVLHSFMTGERHLITHTICPTCFAKQVPGTHYPAE